jgi:hypothetical protein
MKNYILACILICIFVFSISCKRDPAIIQPQTSNNSPFYGRTDSFLIRNFIFNPGSYWIYKDSVLNTIDSCYVINRIMRDTILSFPSYSPSVGPITAYERDYYNSKSIIANQYNYYISNNFIWFFNTFDIYAIELMYDSSNTFVATYYGKPIISTYTIGGVSYTNVYKCFFTTHSQYVPPYPPPLSANVPDSGYYYLKSGVGIIKTVFYFGWDKKVYSLLRYHIQ